MKALIPNIGQPIVAGQIVLKPWYDYFRQLIADVTSGAGDIAALEAAVAALEASVAALEAAQALMQAQIDALEGDVLTLQATVISLQSQINAINALLVFVTYRTGANANLIPRTRSDGIIDPSLTVGSPNRVLSGRTLYVPEDCDLVNTGLFIEDGASFESNGNWVVVG